MSGADPGLCVRGIGGHAAPENFKIWNVRDAISWAFRMNLRQKGGSTKPIDIPQHVVEKCFSLTQVALCHLKKTLPCMMELLGRFFYTVCMKGCGASFSCLPMD